MPHDNKTTPSGVWRISTQDTLGNKIPLGIHEGNLDAICFRLPNPYSNHFYAELIEDFELDQTPTLRDNFTVELTGVKRQADQYHLIKNMLDSRPNVHVTETGYAEVQVWTEDQSCDEAELANAIRDLQLSLSNRQKRILIEQGILKLK